MQSGPLIFFRFGLIDQWNLLTQSHKLANIVAPLKVNGNCFLQ